jgi:hypothetical protein
MPIGQAMGIDHSNGGRKLWPRDVVIGNDNLSAQIPGMYYGIMGSNARVAGHDQVGSLGDKLCKALAVQAMPLPAARYVKRRRAAMECPKPA